MFRKLLAGSEIVSVPLDLLRRGSDLSLACCPMRAPLLEHVKDGHEGLWLLDHNSDM